MPYIKRNRNSNKHTVLSLYCIAGAASGMCPTLTPAQACPILLRMDGSQGDAGILPHPPIPAHGAAVLGTSWGLLQTCLWGCSHCSVFWKVCRWNLDPFTPNSRACHSDVLACLGGEPCSTVGLWRKQSQQTFVQLFLQNQYQFQKLGLLVVLLADCASEPEFGNKPHLIMWFSHIYV